MPFSPSHPTSEQVVPRGFVSGRSRPGLDESYYLMPSGALGCDVPAVRLEVLTGYVTGAALDDIKDFIEWRMAQEATRETAQPPQPARPQLVP